MLADLRQQRENTEQLIFTSEINLNSLLPREQLIGTRNGLQTAEVWLEGRLIEVNNELAALNNVPTT